MLTGSIVAIVTPMHGNGDIDYPTFEKLLDWQVEQGTSGIVVLGTTGESPTITADEKKKLIELAVKAVDGRVPVIIGTGTNATQASIYNTQQAKDLGADMCLTVAPYYNKPTQDGLFAHFSAIADAVDLSQIIYNHTGRCVIDIAPEVTARLSQHKNIVGIKEGSADAARAKELAALCDKDFALYSGDDIAALNFILGGGHGHISVAANIFPAKMQALCQAAVDGKLETAMNLNEALTPLFKALGLETNPTPVKWALHALGQMEAGIRLPLLPLSENNRDGLMDAINRVPSAT